MKDLEKIIQDNKEAFNSEEPSDGHFNRFESKLNTVRPVRRINYLWRAAAVFAIVFLSALYSYEKFYVSHESISEESNELLALGDVSPEYNEVEVYFTSQIQSGINQLEEMNLFDTEDEKQMVLNELHEMDSVYKKLQAELHANPNDQRVIEAMIHYYRTKVNILNDIIMKFENLKQKKYESTKI
jgi:cytochrome c-type biogenesis protein CcmH/NrfG